MYLLYNPVKMHYNFRLKWQKYTGFHTKKLCMEKRPEKKTKTGDRK